MKSQLVEQTGSIMFAIYHSWDGKLNLHNGRLIGPDDIVIEQQTFTLDEFNANDWMLLEEDKPMNKKLYEVYNYVIDFFNDEDYERLQLRDRDINELFDVLVKEKMTIDNKVKVIDFLKKSNSIIKIND